MLDAGLPINHALRTLVSHTVKSAKYSSASNDESCLTRCIDFVERGAGLAESFRRSKIISEFDFVVLNSAEQAGKLADGLAHISQRHIAQTQRIKTIKTSLWLPQAILLVWAFGCIFIRILGSDDSFLQASIPIFCVVMLIFSVTHLLLMAAQRDPRHWLSYLWSSRTIRTQYQGYAVLVEQLFYRALVWQLSAGIAADQATRNSAYLLASKQFQAAVNCAADAINSGTEMPNSLDQYGLILSCRMRRVLAIADQSGRYIQAIDHELNLQQEKIKQKTDSICKWIPKVYMLLAIILTSLFI